MRRLVPVEVTMEKELSDYYEICNISERMIDMETIIDAVFEYTEWTWEGTYTGHRNGHCVVKRGIIDLIANCNGVPILKCAKWTGRNHATVMNSLRAIEDKLDSDRELRNLLREIMEALRFKFRREGE